MAKEPSAPRGSWGGCGSQEARPGPPGSVAQGLGQAPDLHRGVSDAQLLP